MFENFANGVRHGEAYFIIDNMTDKALDIRGGGSASCTPIIEFTCHRQANQTFIFNDAGNGEWEIIPSYAKQMRLDISGGSGMDNAALQIYGANNSAAQRFKLERNKDGIYKILTKCSAYNKGIALKSGCEYLVQKDKREAVDWKIEAVNKEGTGGLRI